MIDIDEFIVPEHGVQSFYELLRSAEKSKAGTLLFSWRVFGTSDVATLGQEDLLIEKMIWRSKDEHPWNRNFKSIHRPEAVKFCIVHRADKLYKPYKRKTISVDEATIHHYWTRTEQACFEKRNKSKATDPEFFEGFHQVRDETILQYLPKMP